MRYRLLLLMILVIVSSTVTAQTTSSAWQTLEQGSVTVRVPLDWRIQPGLPPVAIQDTNSAQISLKTLLLSGQLSPVAAADAVRETYLAASDVTLLNQIPLILPAGDAYRLQMSGNLNGAARRLELFVVPVTETAVILEADLPDPVPDNLLRLVTRIARTLSVNAPGAWATAVSGDVSLRIPADWQQQSTDETHLTVFDPAQELVVTIRQSPPAPTRTFTDLQAQAETIYSTYDTPALEIVSLPAGRAYRALINRTVTNAVGIAQSVRHYQLLLLTNDGSLLVITAGGPVEAFNQQVDLLLTMLDTLLIAAPQSS